MRCARCGNENSEGNRFCGMCGSTLLAAELPVSQTQRAAMGATTSAPVVTTPRPRTPEPPRPAPPPSEATPSISGPSFLGLNDPAPRKKASLRADADSSSGSRNLDYLLEDDEPRHGGAGKIFLILIALALAVGFGYLRWKNHGMDWLKGITSKPPAVAQDSNTSESQPSSAPSSITPEPQTPPATAQPAAPAPATPTTAPSSASNGTPAAPQPDAAATATKTEAAPAAAATPDNATAAPADKEPSPPPAAKQPSDASADENADQPDAASEKPTAKPPAAAKPARSPDSIAEAQKYLYGRGVAQDCDRGMRLLKPAANQGNSKAMIEMGALYSAGLCTPHDLPTAYRWFALALRKDPSNQAIQTDLQKLWGEMTQPERQLAIKLTQ